MGRDIKFRAWCELNSKWVYFTMGEIWSDVMVAVYCRIVIDGGVFHQFTGLTDNKGIDIYEGDTLKFYLCYATTQTHTGDNIPNGSYTEPDEPQLIEILGEVYYEDLECGFSWSIKGDAPYQMGNAFLWTSYEDRIPIIGRNSYHSEEIKDIIGWDDISDVDYEEIINDFGFKSEEEMMSVINTIEVIGNIHQNKDLLK